MEVVRWGWHGWPVLVFPTAGGDAREAERNGLIESLSPLLDAGRIKAYSCDSVAGRAWLRGDHPLHCAWLQNRFDTFLVAELAPFIRADCDSHDIEIICAGASFGAFNAVATVCRHPDVFRLAIGMSGTYDLTPWLRGQWRDDFYFSSPLHYLPGLADGAQLQALRRRFIMLAYGGGRWEDPEQSWRLAGVLGERGIPNRVDAWGPEWDHDWPTWSAMLPRYLDDLA